MKMGNGVIENLMISLKLRFFILFFNITESKGNTKKISAFSRKNGLTRERPSESFYQKVPARLFEFRGVDNRSDWFIFGFR